MDQHLMKTSHSIPASRISKPSWYNKFREQNSLLNQSSSKILLTGGSIISNLRRYLVIWKKYSSSFNSLNFGIPEDKIHYVLWKIQNFSNNSSIKYISFFAEQAILTIIPQKNLSTE